MNSEARALLSAVFIHGQALISLTSHVLEDEWRHLKQKTRFNAADFASMKMLMYAADWVKLRPILSLSAPYLASPYLCSKKLVWEKALSKIVINCRFYFREFKFYTKIDAEVGIVFLQIITPKDRVVQLSVFLHGQENHYSTFYEIRKSQLPIWREQTICNSISTEGTILYHNVREWGINFGQNCWKQGIFYLIESVKKSKSEKVKMRKNRLQLIDSLRCPFLRLDGHILYNFPTPNTWILNLFSTCTLVYWAKSNVKIELETCLDLKTFY